VLSWVVVDWSGCTEAEIVVFSLSLFRRGFRTVERRSIVEENDTAISTIPNTI